MRLYLGALLVLTSWTTRAQTVTVAIDATNRHHRDTIQILGHDVVTIPGKTTVRRLSTRTPVAFLFGKYYAFAGAGDSVHISYDRREKSYMIDGGRYPRNYSAFWDILDKAELPDVYLHPMRYDRYVKTADTITSISLATIGEEKENGTLSPDLAEYLRATLKYSELRSLLWYQRRTHTKLFPATNSTLYPMAGLLNLPEDPPWEADPCISYLYQYLQCRFQTDSGVSSPTQQIDFAIDSLSGGTRERILRRLIVDGNYKTTNDPEVFTARFNRIRELHIDSGYFNAIRRQYGRAMREHRPLGAGLLDRRLLRSLSGDTVSLRSILDTCQGLDLFIEFEVFGIKVIAGGDLDIKPVVANPRVITIDFSTSFHEWRNGNKDRQLSNAFYLPGGLKNPLATYLFIHDEMPTWVALNRSGIIDNIDISLEDMFRYNLIGR